MTDGSELPPIRVPVLLGATASGKTAASLEVASQLGLDIISCDSRQVYRYMEIGTAKPSAAERDRVRHWLLDVVNPDEQFSAHDFATAAARIIRESRASGRRVLLCGGTGFYFSSLSCGLGPQVPGNPALRELYEKKVRDEGAECVLNELRTVDPESARTLDLHNMRRCIRALEVYHTTGRSLSELKKDAKPPRDIEFRVFVATLPRPLLYERINARVDQMAHRGLWEEFRTLLDMGYRRDSPGMRTVGYQELFDVIEKRTSLDQALAGIKQNSRNYAKRQMTWFRNQTDALPVEMTTNGVSTLTGHIEQFLTS